MRALGLSGAAPGRKPRATGPAEGDRAPTGLLRRDFTATGPNRRWVVDFTHVPTWSGYSLHGVRHGPVRPPHRRLGHQRAHGAPTTRAAPWNTRSRRARNAGARTWRGWCTTATADPSHLSIAYTRRLVQEGTRGLRRSRGLLLRQRRRRGPQQVLQARARLARRPLEGTRRPRQPRPPDGWTGTTAPDPTSPTTTTSHPQPSNTATITTTPPPHPPPYNQPSTKPGTIQARVVGLCERGWGRRGLG